LVAQFRNTAQDILPLTWKRVALLAVIAALVTATFTTAVFVFVGPIRLISLAFDHLGWSGEFERLTVAIAVFGMAIVLLVITVVISGVVLGSRYWHVRVGIFAILIVFGGMTTILWLHPNMMVEGLSDEIVSKENFAFGSYPSEDRIEELDRLGYSIVTLLHPAILPYEKRLLEIERESAEEVGANLIEIPMLPWMAQNRQAMELLLELGKDHESKYYVHCWFGMHRTVDAANLIFDPSNRSSGLVEFPEGHGDRDAIFSVPSLALIAQLGGPLLFITGMLAFGTGWLKVERHFSTADTRKVFHVAIFTIAAGFQLTLGLPAVILFGVLIVVTVFYAVYRGEGFAFYDALARSRESESRKMLVLIPLISTGLGGVISNSLFFGWAHVGYLACGWGDAAGETIGKRFGRHQYRVRLPFALRADRSIEGSVGVFVVATVSVMAGLMFGGLQFDQVIWVAPLVGVVTAIAEAVSGGATDNFSIQVAATGTAYALAHNL
jgi:phytol kinase